MRRNRRTEAGPAHRQASARGFTLIEAVMVIAISGVVIAMVAIFIVPSITAYFASATRARLGDEADTALRRIGRDLTAALPNSVRITGNSVELIPVSGAARYAVGTEAGDPLLFGTVDTSFAIVGPALRLASGNQRLAWYNLGNGVPDADAYTLANVRVSSTAAGNATSVAISGAALPNSLQAPPYRVYAIEQPVTYRCDTTAGTLTRYTGYGFLSTQPDPPPGGGSAAVLAQHVQSCSFSYSTPTITARYALVTLSIQLSANGETITLYHTVHVDNLP
ncbi:type II secretion system protein J [Roseateles sp. BYS78W]|uniref:Type II secretion system protein J n=1 Tax=Pelomonas candidula TaxID=3299025 RepID=A0ABW7HCP5_9BURK